MWLFKLLLLSLSLVSLSHCGFTPAYSKHHTARDAATENSLAAITIDPIPHRIGQEFHSALSDLLNPTQINQPPHYQLAITLEKTNNPFVIEANTRITRYNLIITAHYVLTDLQSKKKIDEGKVRVTGSYDALVSRFSTFIAEQDATSNIIKEMAEELKLRLTAALLNHIS